MAAVMLRAQAMQRMRVQIKSVHALGTRLYRDLLAAALPERFALSLRTGVDVWPAPAEDATGCRVQDTSKVGSWTRAVTTKPVERCWPCSGAVALAVF